MNIRFNQIVTTGDWVKIGILLGIAIMAWYYVFTIYSQPLELANDIELQRIHQQYEYSKQPPLVSPE
ncbi:MAG: hypothetical protein Q7S23_01670 [bacterium]|nr:hypothetical protein [bacterium]